MLKKKYIEIHFENEKTQLISKEPLVDKLKSKRGYDTELLQSRLWILFWWVWDTAGIGRVQVSKKILAKHQQRILVNREYLETNFAIICQEVRRSINKNARSPV